MRELKIGNLTVSIPIIQGGMGVGVSLSSLASAVANEGGVGVISAAAIGISEKDFFTNIEEHDFNFKIKNACKFLQDGDKVKASIRFRGREMRYIVQGQEVLARFAEALKDVGTVEKQSKLEGKLMIMIMCPKKLIS